MRATSQVYERILAWRATHDKLNNMIEPVVQPGEVPAIPTIERQPMVAPSGPQYGPGGQVPQPNLIGEAVPSPQVPAPAIAPGFAPGGMPGAQPIPRVPTGVEQLDLLAPKQTTFLGPPAPPKKK
jgi:hypothetical protein